MKKLLSIAILSTLLAFFVAGCSEGNVTEEFMPDIVEGGASITKAELIDAIWNEDGELSPDVLCLVTSTFTIKSNNTFTIARNGNPTDLNSAQVVIVSPLNIEFEDPASDGRGPSCAPEAMLQYDVSASEQEPLDIETATALRARHSLIHMVSGAHTEYPGCTIRAHFDKAGKAICNPDLIPDEEEDVVAEDEDADDQADDDSAEDDSAEEDDSADDDDDDGITIVTPIPGVWGRLTLKAQNVNADGVPCGLEEIKSVRLVVDDYDCRLEGYTPRPLLY
jgi:hypothetical protein